MNPTLRYTHLGFAVAALLDREEPPTTAQAHDYVRNGSLFDWLGRVSIRMFGAAIGLSSSRMQQIAAARR